MAEVRLTAQARTEFGKGASRRLRREGRVPAVLYGDGDAPRHLSLDDHDLTQALKQAKVILEIDVDADVIPTAPRDVQRDPVRGFLKHIDLVALDRAQLKARQVAPARRGLNAGETKFSAMVLDVGGMHDLRQLHQRRIVHQPVLEHNALE